MKAAATADQRAAALADLDQAMALEPPRAPVLAIDGTNRARLLDRDGRAGEALAACDAALAVTPEGAARQRLETQLVKLAILSRLERFDDVIRACDEAIATGLASPKLLELRALARSFRHDFPAAIDDLTRAITLAPDAERPPLLARRGELYLMTEATRLALRDFDDALRMNSSLVEAHAGRGLVLALQGDPDAAAQAAEEVFRVGEDQSPTPPYLAARILAQTASSVLDPPRRPGALEKATRFQHRARALLGLALERVPSTDRSAFARRRIDPDPLLRRLIGGTRPPS